MGFKSSIVPSRATGMVALLLLAACGGGTNAGAAPTESLRDASTGRRDGGADAGKRDGGADAEAGSEGGAVISEDGPLLKILSPVETDDPASADVLVANVVTVRCEAKQNPMGKRVDPNSVGVAIYDGDETTPLAKAKALSTGTPDVFEVQNVDLTALPHGRIRVECLASDLETPAAATSVAKAYTLFDKGPTVEFLSPRDKGFVSAVAGKEGEDLRVRFKVTPASLGDDDVGADIASVTAMVGGKMVPQLDPENDGVYSFKLDFNDTTFFPTLPETLSVRVNAANKRQPKARSITANLNVGVDSKGPTIVIKAPARVGGLAPIVSGKVDVILEIKDALAGVEPGSVEIAIQRKDKGLDKVPATAQANDVYVAYFETGSYPDLSSLNITITAADKVGIVAQTSLAVDVDTVAPWLSMDTPTVREVFPTANIKECTGPFDPLADSVTEGVVHGQSFLPRVIIWDRALVVDDTQRVARYAGIDNTTAKLYIQHNNDIPLLVDTDNDPNHYCDNVLLKPTDMSKEPVTLKLTGIPSMGAAPAAVVCPATSTNYTLDLTSEPTVTESCVSINGNCDPVTISDDSTMTRVIKHTAASGGAGIPAVYAFDPAFSGLSATGRDYQAPRPGWACLVAVAKDNAGNFAFSPPMRVCTERNQAPLYTCESATPPASLTCTDGCVIPAQFLANAPDGMPRLLRYSR